MQAVATLFWCVLLPRDRKREQLWEGSGDSEDRFWYSKMHELAGPVGIVNEKICLWIREGTRSEW